MFHNLERSNFRLSSANKKFNVRSKRPQEAAQSCQLAHVKRSSYNTHMVDTNIADKNENRVYHTNRYDTIQTLQSKSSNVKYWYFKSTREKRDTSRFRDSSQEK